MSVELVDVTGRVLTLKVTGLLTEPELTASQRVAGELIDQLGKTRLLILVEDFKGVAQDGDWGDISFQADYDSFIERIAIVSEAQWKESALLFTGKGIRKVAIEHFQPADLDRARAWISAN